MKTFESFKNYLLEKGKEKSACKEEYARVYKSTSIDELILVVRDNLNWCYSNEVISANILLEYVETQDLNNAQIYVKQNVKELTGNDRVWLINSTVSEMRENSTVSEMRENSTVSEMRENSTVSIMRENSTVSEMRENSTVSEMRENSTVSVMWGNSTVSEMWGNSTVSEMRENSTVSEMWGNSTVSEMRGNSLRRNFSFSEKPKLYIKKDSHEIILLD